MESLSDKEQEIAKKEQSTQDKLESLGKERRRLKNESASKKLKRNVRRQISRSAEELKEIQEEKESVQNQIENLKQYEEKFQSLLNKIKR